MLIAGLCVATYELLHEEAWLVYFIIANATSFCRMGLGTDKFVLWAAAWAVLAVLRQAPTALLVVIFSGSLVAVGGLGVAKVRLTAAL